MLTNLFKPRKRIKTINGFAVEYSRVKNELIFCLGIKSEDDYNISSLLKECELHTSLGMVTYRKASGLKCENTQIIPQSNNETTSILGLIKSERTKWLNTFSLDSTYTCDVWNFVYYLGDVSNKKCIEIIDGIVNDLSRFLVERDINVIPLNEDELKSDIITSAKKISFNDKSEPYTSLYRMSNHLSKLEPGSVILKNDNNHNRGFCLFNSDTNFNLVSLFTGGSGSHFFHSDMISEILHVKGMCIVFDSAGRYDFLCKSVGGKSIKITEELCFNPFYYLTVDEHLVQGRALDVIKIIVTSHYGTLSDFEYAHLEKALCTALSVKTKHIGFKDIVDSFEPEIEHIKKFLYKFTVGEFSHIVNGQPDISFSDSLTVFDMFDISLNPEIHDVCIASLLEHSRRQINIVRTPLQQKVIFIDEAEEVLTDRLSKYIEGFARSLRKRFASLCVRVRAPDSLIRNESIKVLINISNWKVVGQLHAEDINKFKSTEMDSFLGMCDFSKFQRIAGKVKCEPHKNKTGLLVMAPYIHEPYNYYSDPYGYFMHGYKPELLHLRKTMNCTEYSEIVNSDVKPLYCTAKL